MSDAKTTKLASFVCPYCGKKLTHSTGLFGAENPSPGDVSICIKCAEPALFDDHMQLRKPTAIESVEIEADEKIVRSRRAILKVRADQN